MIYITEINPADKIALRELFLNVRQTTFTWTDQSKFQLSDFDEETEDEFILVARVDNRVAGFISVWPPDNFIHHLYVGNEFQKKGIGTKLLHAFFAKTNAPVTLKCLEENVNAIAFYKKNGFFETEKGESIGGKYILFEYVKPFL